VFCDCQCRLGWPRLVADGIPTPRWRRMPPPGCSA
jgi:hypothetical protein